ncbi:MAG: hypothetical protein C3F02_02820 [Parcubacteria group bacterium]|nr:MAG: hypothetical protein C3F02_02820 [Parcubacteria group bacterium]
MDQKINKKSLYSYIIITFGLTLIVVGVMAGLQMKMVAGALSAQLVLAGLMFLPTIATIITRQFITKEGWATAGWHWGAFKNYLNVWLLIPAVFIIIYTLTYILGAPVDFSLSGFASQYGLTLPLPGPLIVLIIFLFTFLFTPFVNSVAGLGEELGWRGHLLPHLLPLGEKKALVISGLIWGLWHVPFVVLLGFGGYSNVWLGALFFIAMATFLGIYIGYLRLHSGSSILAGWAHGVFNSQAYGIWAMIFPAFNHFIGGPGGLVGLVVLGVVAWYSFRLLDQHNLKKISVNL